MSNPLPQVLVVDDERFFREAICEALASAGIECRSAETGSEAVEAAGDARIGVVVLDVGLPDASGIEVLKKLRQERPLLRVIVVSTEDDQEVVLEALRMGACDYLAKPLHEEELVLAVRRAGEGHVLEARGSELRERLVRLDARIGDLCARARGADGPIAEHLGLHVTRAVSEILGAEKTSWLCIDPDGVELRVAAAPGRDFELEEMDSVAVGEAIAGFAFASGEPLLVRDVDSDPRCEGRTHGERYTTRSLIAAPVPGSAGPIGVLCATDRDGGEPFSGEDVALLRILARQLGAIVEGPPARASDDVVTPAEPVLDAEGPDDAELARTICDVLTTEVEPERVILRALEAVANSLPAAPVALYMRDPETGALRLDAQCDSGGRVDRPRLDGDAGLTVAVLKTGSLVATDHPESDPRFAADIDTALDGAVGALLCVPVRLRGKTVGVLRAFPSDGASASARTGEIVAAAISAAVRNVLLYRSLLESIDDVARARRETQGRP
jgi:FixJ family two-component response regulator/putative methionine-R-sulfoxide reductase with GAF domain